MSKMPWFRVYSELLDDKKIKRICRATSFSKATVIGVWISLLALANDSSDRGTLQISEGIPYEISDIACETEMPDDQIGILIKLFEEYDMLTYDNRQGWHISNWDGRQFKSDNVAARVAKHRANKAKQKTSNNMKRYSNVIESDTDTDTDTDTESELLDAFCEITGIPKTSNGSVYAKWLTTVSEWVNMGVTRADIQKSFDIAMAKDYTISQPSSLINFIRGEMARNNGSQSSKQEYIGPNGEVIKI